MYYFYHTNANFLDPALIQAPGTYSGNTVFTLFPRYDSRCSTNIPLLLLKYKLVETASLNSAINICMRKTKSTDGQAITVSDVLNKENLERMVEDDEVFKFLKTVRSAPAFWQQKQRELMSVPRSF